MIRRVIQGKGYERERTLIFEILVKKSHGIKNQEVKTQETRNLLSISSYLQMIFPDFGLRKLLENQSEISSDRKRLHRLEQIVTKSYTCTKAE
jgi:hypothetical protein